MLFDTPKTLEAALILINLYDSMYWELYAACGSALVADNNRIHRAKQDGCKSPRSAFGKRALEAIQNCDAAASDMRRWMQAHDLGGQRPAELAIHTYLTAVRATGDRRRQGFADLNALLDTMEPAEWTYAVALEGRYGREVVTGFCLHVARRLMAPEGVA